MPILTVNISSAPNAALFASIAAELTALTKFHLHKDPALTAVAIRDIPPGAWFVGEASLSSQAVNSFMLDIKVTAATNTKAEFAEYIAAVFQVMGRLLGPLHDASYVVIDEVPASAWGFGGNSQEHRFIAGRIKSAA